MALFGRKKKDSTSDKKNRRHQKEENRRKIPSPDPWILYAPVSGKTVALSEIDDPEFADGALGHGIGIKPESGLVHSPCDGTVAVVFQQGHAVAIKTLNGMEVLIHMGVNSVVLNGIGFKKKVFEGEEVLAGDDLIEFDPQLMREFNLDDTVVVTVHNTKDFQQVAPIAKGHVEAYKPLIQVVK